VEAIKGVVNGKARRGRAAELLKDFLSGTLGPFGMIQKVEDDVCL
jgi:hypothetical protein